MARDTDRKKVSEAIRLQSTWRIERLDPASVLLITDFDERLSIWYGGEGQIKRASYTHWDRDTGRTACHEDIARAKRKRVLHLIGTGSA